MLAAGAAGGAFVAAAAVLLLWSGILAGGDNSDEIETLRGEVASLRGEIDSANASGDVTALSSQVEDLRGQAGDGMAALEERLSALEASIADVADAPDAAASLDAIQGQLAETETRLSQVDTASQESGERLDGIEASLQELAVRIEELEASSGTERLIAASALKAAIDRGDAFETELDALADLDEGADEAEGLRPFAAEGLPTRAEIAREANAAARAMATAARPAPQETGFMGRLVSSAQSMVSVRPVGTAQGEDAGSAIARLEAAISADDYAGALAEYETLPPQVQAAGADFMEKVRARAAADRLIDEALSQALQES